MAERIILEMKFSFPAVISLLLCTDSEGKAVLCLLACALHETGHLAVMFAEKKPPRKITFYGGGIEISDCGFRSIPVLLGGCAANFLLSAIFLFFPYYSFKLFGMINLLTGFLNLLPIRPLDGGQLLEKLLLRLLPPEKAAFAVKTVEIISAAIVLPLTMLLLVKGMIGFSAIIFLIYLLGVEILRKV